MGRIRRKVEGRNKSRKGETNDKERNQNEKGTKAKGRDKSEIYKSGSKKNARKRKPTTKTEHRNKKQMGPRKIAGASGVWRTGEGTLLAQGASAPLAARGSLAPCGAASRIALAQFSCLVPAAKGGPGAAVSDRVPFGVV